MNKIRIVKVGGAVLENDDKRKEFLRSFSELPSPKILVHGGGRLADEYLNRLGIKPLMKEGRRITDEQTLDVVTMVYGGLVNKKIVAELQSLGQNALGLSGADLGLIESVKRPAEPVDYGFAGDIVQVKGSEIQRLLELNNIPVFAPLTFSVNGQLLNTNADTIASKVAESVAELHKVELVFCFEMEGVLDQNKNVISEINLSTFQKLKQNGTISGGMIPKLENAFSVIQKGVTEVKIVSYRNLLGEAGTRLTI